MIKDIRSISLLDILPENLLQDKQVNAAARALDGELQKVSEAVRETLILSRIDELPETVLDLLAWQWHVDFYEPVGMDIGTKRNLIRESIAWHRIKGTPAAVERLLSTVFGKTTVEEWYEYDGEHHTFRLSINGEGAFDEKRTINELMDALESSKNKRSHLGGKHEILLKFSETQDLPFGIALPVESARRIDIQPLKREMPSSLSVGFLMGNPSRGIREALPEKVHMALAEGMFHGLLLHKHQNAIWEPFEPKEFKPGTKAGLFVGMYALHPPERMGIRLPIKKKAGLCFHVGIPLSEAKGIKTALPKDEILGGLSTGFAMKCMLPMHIKARPVDGLEPEEWDISSRCTGIRAGALVHEPAPRKTCAAILESAFEGVSVGVLVGTVMPKHVSAYRKE